MAKLLRAWILMMCLMLIMPYALATDAGIDDIIDEPAGTVEPASTQLAPTAADLLGSSASPDVNDAGNGQDADSDDGQPQNQTTGAPNFSAIDPAQATGKSADGAGQSVDITKNCKYKVTEGKMSPMGDSKLSTYWSNKKKARITITLPAGDTAGWLYIEWYKKPTEFRLVEKDASKTEIKTSDQSIYTGLINCYPLQPETKLVEFTLAKGNAISTLRVFSQGELPSSAQNWEAPVDKADLMVIAAHQCDEFLYMGGTIPYYESVRGKAVQVVYMANGGRARYKEAMNGLWAVGMRHMPDFVGFPDKSTKKLSDAVKVWDKDKVLEQLVTRIRKYKPEVIVTHDRKGEYGHGAHMLIAELIDDAVEQAADESKFPTSANAYGVWQVSKLYLHLAAENPITMDWSTSYPELDNRSPSDMAKTGFAAHKSQQSKFKYEDGGQYDNSKFGLVFTTVGEDVNKNDFFENIPEAGEVDPALALNPSALGADDSDGPSEVFPLDNDSTGDLDDPGDDGLDQTNDQDDETEPRPTETFAPPVESADQNNTFGFLGSLLGVPVLLGGSAFGFAWGRKYLKKRRRVQRQAERKQNTDQSA